jgi:anti-sigma28 factor (negative regulator of flagellin synthesis)
MPLDDSVETSRVAAALKAQEQKIERLRAAVQDGIYHVPARDIAAKIVAERLDESAGEQN